MVRQFALRWTKKNKNSTAAWAGILCRGCRPLYSANISSGKGTSIVQLKNNEEADEALITQILDDASFEEYLKLTFKKYQIEFGTLQSAIYHTLEESIFTGKLAGEIAEPSISSILGVSRTPVREAMHKLSAVGFLEISHGRKVKVVPITQRDFQDISLVLRELHRIAIELCVRNRTQEDLDKMDEALALIDLYTEREDYAQLIHYNTEFHRAIVEGSKNKWLKDIVCNLMNYTSVFRMHVIQKEGRKGHARDEHRQIYKAIVDRDSELAKKLITEHVNKAFMQDS